MSRWALALVFAAAAWLCAQTPPPPATQDKKPPAEMKRDRTQATSDKEEVPPEEDSSLSKEDFSFNPLQSKRDVEVGDEYRKKGNFPAAARRYTTATRYNEGNAEAWLKLAQARQKMKDNTAAKEAYAKYLELDPDSKMAQEVKKTLAKLK